jgi:hypothetical protein
MATKKTTAKFGSTVKVQRGYPGKIRSAKDQGYTPIGKREPARTKFDDGGALSSKAPKEAKMKFYSPDGNYKTVVKKNYGEPERAKETRTLKGVLRGVNKPTMNVEPQESKPEVFSAKKGGWIQGAIKKPGALRASLGVKKGEKIPKAKLAAAAKKGGKLGQRARLAITLSKMRKK